MERPGVWLATLLTTCSRKGTSVMLWVTGPSDPPCCHGEWLCWEEPRKEVGLPLLFAFPSQLKGRLLKEPGSRPPFSLSLQGDGHEGGSPHQWHAPGPALLPEGLMLHHAGRYAAASPHCSGGHDGEPPLPLALTQTCCTSPQSVPPPLSRVASLVLLLAQLCETESPRGAAPKGLLWQSHNQVSEIIDH